MRIFQVCGDPGIPFDGTKGASVHLRALADALQRRGHEVHVFASNPRVSRREDRGIDVRALERGSLEDAASRLGRPDFVYERYALGHDSGLQFARRVRSPFVLEVNAPLVLEASRHRPHKLRASDGDLERRMFRQADVAAAVSEPLRRYVAGIRGTDRGTVVVRNGCDPAQVGPPAGLTSKKPETLVFLGHPKPWHGAEGLPRILAELVTRGCDVKLLLIGGGPRSQRVLQRARNWGVSDRVEVTGPLSTEDAARRLREGMVAVAPYPPDPFFYFCPLKVMECMAAGLPVVTTAQGDLREILGDAGVAVAPGDLHAMTDAIEHLLQNEPLRRALGTRARERALSTFTWSDAADRLIRAVNDITMRQRVA
jgi:glycosyltransferase involved in cell wall biosynthesis